MRFSLSFTFGKTMQIESSSYETFSEVLERMNINQHGFKTLIFFNGKQVCLESSVEGTLPRENAKVICLLKKIQLPRDSPIQKEKVNPKDYKMKLMKGESARVVDNYYNMFEMNPKKDIVFKEAVKKQIKLDNMNPEECFHETNLSYLPKISEEPLPFISN